MNILTSIVTAVTCLFAITFPSYAHASQSEQEQVFNKQFYRHIMFRETPYASYRGIHQLNVNQSPNLAHYQFEYDDLGRVRVISYQNNGKLIKGNEVWDSFIWFAPKVKIDYQSGKEIHHYFDANNQPIAAHGNVYRAEYQLDQNNQRVGLRFFNKQGKPSESAWNIHRYQWHQKNGKVYEKRFNLKGEQQPLRPEFKFYEVELEYDDDGKLAFVRNLGLEGKPANNDSGAGIDRITYDHNGNFVRWQVYDKDGAPVEGNRPMVHLGEHLYDQYGNKVGLRGYDRFGKQIPFSWGALEHSQTYDHFGNQVSHIMTNADGSFNRHLTLQYNADNTQISWLKSLNKQGELAGSPMLGGAALLQYIPQADGTIKRKLFNADMSEFVPVVQGSSK